MSLIQEALHRRDAELGKPMLAIPQATPPPPLPPPPATPPEPERRTPAFGKIIVLVVLLFGLLGYGGWYFFLRTPDRPAPIVAKPPPATNQPVKVSMAQPLTNIVVQAKAKLETTITPERTELVMGKTNASTAQTKPPPTTPPPAPGTLAITNMPPPAISTNETPAVVKAPSTPVPALKPPPAQIRWPKLNITGIMGRSGGDSVAFINGQILKAGDTIADARVLAVAESGVQMLFQGETNTIRVGKGSE